MAKAAKVVKADEAREILVQGNGGAPAPFFFFFIVGCPRSGTTLLRWMLDSHPSIAVTPETHFGERYLTSRERGARDLDFDASSSRSTATSASTLELDRFCESPVFKEMSIDERTLRERASLEPNDPWRPLRLAMEDFGRRRDVSIVGEKTPSHSLHLEALAEAFPDARFLMLRRDPRAVAASWQRASWSRHSTRQIAETWCRYSRAMGRSARQIGPRCLEISYEELVRNPTRLLASICEFLGTDFDSGMLLYHERRQDSTSPEERADHALTFEQPKPARIDAWRTELSRADLREIEAICARPMAQRGYLPATSLRERLPDMLRMLPSSWRKRIKRRLRRRP